MTGRARVKAALDHKHTDRILIAMVCSGINSPAREQTDELLRKTRGISLSEYLNDLLDVVYINPEYAGPELAPGTDIWGVRRSPVSFGDGAYDEIEYYPLAQVENVDELKSYPWPTPEYFDYTGLPERISRERHGPDRCLMSSNGNIFESSWYMRGFERFFVDLIVNPRLAETIMDRVLEFYLTFFDNVLKAAGGEIDLVFTADDLGCQTGLLMSREMWVHFIRPRHTELNALIHSYGAKVIYHTDGAVMEIVDGLIDTGVDVLQALQFDAAGMDPAKLKTRFGQRLCFEGGVSVQHTLPFGTRDDVEKEVRGLIEALGKDGGYILGPSHAIQAGTPPENIVSMFDTAASYYPFG